MSTRISIEEYYLQVANLVGTRGTCDRGRIGVVIVKDKRILTTGYVGSPAGIIHCDDVGHEMHTVIHEDGTKSRHCVRTAHAEINAICNAARHGVAIDGATLYGRFEPCYTCAKAIINAGIRRVVCEKAYHAAQESRRILKEANVELVVMNPNETEQYSDQKVKEDSQVDAKEDENNMENKIMKYLLKVLTAESLHIQCMDCISFHGSESGPQCDKNLENKLGGCIHLIKKSYCSEI